jgi:hypothetical protein
MANFDDGEEPALVIRAWSTEIATKADAQQAGKGKRKGRRVPPIPPADMYLVFDTETTTDPAMRCRIGFYQLHHDGALLDERLFYDPRERFPGDTQILKAYAAERGMAEPVTLNDFRTLFLHVVRAGGQIVGFNLPFDLSRLATGSSPAKTHRWNKRMQGGHSLKFSDSVYVPRIQVKHINPRLALIGCTVPSEGKARSARKRRDDIPADRGTFIDVRTIASAILSGSFSLERLCERLKTATRKRGVDDHGKPLTFDYIDYARDDVQATWECFCALRTRYAAFGMSAPIHTIKSEAGLGKAMLADMGIKIISERDPAKIGRSLHSYFGGRTEVRIRRTPTRVILTDFISMYPTNCTLMGLWRFVISSSTIERDATEEIRALVANSTPADWQSQDQWSRLTALVRVKCDHDMFPVRSFYDGEQHASIGLNFLTDNVRSHWFTLPDCLAAKFLSGKTPEIVEAVSFEPGPPQQNLKPIDLLGRLTIDPHRDDAFRELIAMRERENIRLAELSGDELERAEEFRQFLKILANSTSYGSFLQLNITDEERKVRRMIHVHGQRPFEALVAKSEQPGPCFNPLLGTLITGAARLMLALAQWRAEQEGLGWAFCDTDSLALAKPDGMDDADFIDRATRVSKWFAPLNPYGFSNSILKLESVNFAPGTKDHEPLYCYAIASKRYALFNIDGEGRPRIRKASAHGLGHMIEPYGDDDGAPDFPAPLNGLMAGKDRLARWQYDAWYAILSHELSDKASTERVQFNYHPKLLQPCVSKFSATSPALLRWMDAPNQGQDYTDQVKPFGLLYCLHAKATMTDFTGPEARSGRKLKDIHPVAPFHPDLEQAITQAFDRVTGEPISSDQLQTYAETLFNYPHRQESKFQNGGPFQRGLTQPRHVVAGEVHYIGKEADRWEEDFLIGTGFDPITQFGRNPDDDTDLFDAIREAARIHGQKPVSDATGLARGSIRRICEGKFVRTATSRSVIRLGLRTLDHPLGVRTSSTHPTVRVILR